jgi:hypothetical protein
MGGTTYYAANPEGVDGLWSNPDNWTPWTGIVPGADDVVCVTGARTIVVDGQQFIKQVYPGYGWNNNYGWMRMDDPDASLTVGVSMYVAGTWDDGSVLGEFIQNAGTVTIATNLDIKTKAGTSIHSTYPNGTAWGRYTLNNGTLTVNNRLECGVPGKGMFVQNGGTANINWAMVGYGNKESLGAITDIAYYTMNAGVLNVSYNISLGVNASGRGVFYLGNANTTGTINGVGGLWCRDSNTPADGVGVFQGWGNVNLTGALHNNDKVIADGVGKAEDRDLNMSSFSSVVQDETYTLKEGEGWYAINRGRLILPSIAVAAGTSTRSWGETVDDTTIDLVNSVLMSFTDVNGGNVVGKLMARDRSDVGLGTKKIIGVWDFSASTVDFGSGTATLTFKYDAAQAAELEIAEADLKLFAVNNGAIQELPFTIDTTSHMITLSNVTSLGTYAIGIDALLPIPEPEPEMVIPGGPAPVVDGDLSDWADATWINMNKIWGMSNVDGYTVNAADYDLSSAKIAMRWSPATNKIYLAVMAVDTQHYFTDPVSIDPQTGAAIVWPAWNEVDQIEVYVDAGNHNNTEYCYDSGMYQQAQQYVGGRDNTGAEFMALGGSSGIMNVNTNGIVSAFKTSVNGDVISYEMAITPYDNLNIQYADGAYDLSGLAESTVVTLQAGTVVGLDVCVSSRFNADGNSCFCQRYWWEGSNEWMDASAFPDWTLTAAPVTLIPGDANGDGMVDVGDLGILAANYGGTGKSWAEGDFNGDGLVDVGDLGILAANYGTGNSNAANFDADYAKVFGTATEEDDAEDTTSSLCSSFGLSLIAGIALMGLLMVKLEE